MMASLDILLERFFARVKFTETCWLWTGPYHEFGYGRFGQRGIKTREAYRWLWEVVNYPVPKGLCLDHRCKNPPCVNPDHLAVTTTRLNTLRGNGPFAQKARQTHCKRGHSLAGDNLYIQKSGRYYRRACLTCRRAANAVYGDKARARYLRSKAQGNA